MSSELLKQYEPENIQEFLGNKMVIKQLQENLGKGMCRVLLIGPSGSGKTTLCELALKAIQQRYDILKITDNDAEDVKSLKRLVENFVSNKTIESFFSTKKKFVFFDDVDILLSSDRNTNSFIMSFVELVQQNDKVSFIMTASSSEEKRLTELKKKLSCLRISNPSRPDVYNYVSSILDNESVSYDSTKLLKLIDTHNNNIRNIFNNLHQMSLDDEDLDEIKNSKIMFDSNVFDIMMKIYKEPIKIKDTVYLSDNNLVPLLLHENILTEIQKKRLKQSKEVYFDMLYKMNDTLLAADALEQYMYANTDWGLYDTAIVLKYSSISQAIHSIEKKKSYGTDNYIFTQILTKAALKCHFNKRLTLLKDAIGINETDSIYYLLDCYAEEFTKRPSNMKAIKDRLKEGGLTKDDIATVYQYFSLFVEMDKPLLNKIKKLL